MFDRWRSVEDRQGLRDRIIARYNAKTGSDAGATHGPLVEAILEELLPEEPAPASPTTEADA